jgi:hypothetical protein
VHRNLIQQNVAADPTGAASSCRERLATFEGRQRKGEMRNEKDGANSPGVEVVVQDEEIRGSVFEDGAFHFRIGGVDDSAPWRLGLALQLKRRVARRTDIVDGGGALGCRAKAR